MRLWSIHPRHLDSKGLVALWREGLLARKVLMNETRGYKNHPQLERFRAAPDPSRTLEAYLHHVVDEADRRSYRFDRSKLGPRLEDNLLNVTRGQVSFEHGHLRKKLDVRAPPRAAQLPEASAIETHPLFRIIEGPISSWERV